MRRLLPVPADEVNLTSAYALPPGAARHLRANFVCSADGAVSLAGRSGGLSGPADKRVFAVLRDLADVVLVGAGTARAEGYRPARPDAARRATRRAAGLAEVPTIALVSSELALDPDWPVLAEAEARTIVVTHEAAPAAPREALAGVADFVVAGTDRVDLAAALDQLAARGLARVLCEGGPMLFGSLLAADLVDELCLTVSPLVAGPGAGRIVAGAPVDGAQPTRLVHVLEGGGSLFLRYALARGAGVRGQGRSSSATG
jgi:riboflavin biosynthesis pyrimidine reductase